ncbi:SMAD/FHA domain-containing protein, partial [Gloeophyllum trabeum ATCC 11539]
VADKEKDKAKPNFNPSGLLAAATKTVEHGDGSKTVLKYHEPPEARKPHLGWRLYVFKGKEQVDLLHIHRQSAYLIGRDRTVADIPVEHPSCSKQHAVIQHRQVMEKNEFGEAKQVIKPFVIDLESTNGTSVNDEQIPTSRYFELQAGDVIKFGDSLREYVLLHDEAA